MNTTPDTEQDAMQIEQAFQAEPQSYVIKNIYCEFRKGDRKWTKKYREAMQFAIYRNASTVASLCGVTCEVVMDYGQRTQRIVSRHAPSDATRDLLSGQVSREDSLHCPSTTQQTRSSEQTERCSP